MNRAEVEAKIDRASGLHFAGRGAEPFVTADGFLKLAEQLKEAMTALEEIRDEACICHLDYHSNCDCPAGDIARRILSRWEAP